MNLKESFLKFNKSFENLELFKLFSIFVNFFYSL